MYADGRGTDGGGGDCGASRHESCGSIVSPRIIEARWRRHPSAAAASRRQLSSGPRRVSARSRWPPPPLCRPCNWLRAAAQPALVEAVFNPVNRLVLLARRAGVGGALRGAALPPDVAVDAAPAGNGVAGRDRLRPCAGRDDAARGGGGSRAGDFGRGAVDPDRERPGAQPPAAGADGVARGGDGLADRLRGQRRARHGRCPKRRVAAVAAAQLRDGRHRLFPRPGRRGRRRPHRSQRRPGRLPPGVTHRGRWDGRGLEGQSQAAGARGRGEDHPPGRRGPGEPGGRHGGGPVQTRSQRDRQAAVAAHRLSLRLRRRQRRAVLLRDGAAGWHQPAGTGRRLRSAGTRSGRPRAVPDVRVAPRGARARPGAPGPEAVERHGVPGGPHVRLRQGAGLWAGQDHR